MTRSFTCAPTSSTSDEKIYAISVLNDEFDDSSGGDCSLREALYDINHSPSPLKVTVELGLGEYNLELAGDNEDNGKTGDLDIKRNLIITGQGLDETVLNAEDLGDRLFEIHDGESVTLKNLTLKGGSICNERSSSSLCSGGAVFNAGSLYLENVHIVENFAYDSETYSAKGGALYNGGTLILKNAIIDNNMTIDTDGVWKNQGGAIYSVGPLTIDTTSLLNNSNQGVYGGALTIDGSDTTIKNSFVGMNVCSSFMLGCSGGAIAIFNSPIVQILNTTLADNRINVTMTSPSSGAVKAQGSGIFVAGSTLTLQGVTLAKNTCEGAYDNIVCAGGGLAVSARSDVSFKNSLLVGNTVIDNGEKSANDLIVVNDNESQLHSNGKNILGTISLDGLSLAESDILGVSETGLIGNFENHPEPGKSFYAIVNGSYAVDAGLAADCGSGSSLEKDQIDQPRSGTSCDIGAIECIECTAFVASNDNFRKNSLETQIDLEPSIDISAATNNTAADPADDATADKGTSFKTFNGGAVFDGGGCQLSQTSPLQAGWLWPLAALAILSIQRRRST